jgi:hypothetical protein
MISKTPEQLCLEVRLRQRESCSSSFLPKGLGKSSLKLAERVGVSESDSAEPREIDSDSRGVAKSITCCLPAFASACVRLRPMAPVAGAMSRELSLSLRRLSSASQCDCHAVALLRSLGSRASCRRPGRKGPGVYPTATSWRRATRMSRVRRAVLERHQVTFPSDTSKNRPRGRVHFIR